MRDKSFSRDIDALRQHYLEHKQVLDRLASDAPTETLAQRYRQISSEIDASIRKLAELEREGDSAKGEDAISPKTGPGLKPLRTGPQTSPLSSVIPAEGASPRTMLIVATGVLVLGLLGFFIWRFATGEEEPAPVQNVAAPTSIETAAPPAKPILTVEPLTQDYGTVRRGSRATRQFELLNNTDQPLSIRAQRSQCRCLWFEYADTIPPQGSTTMTVTVDGAKANEGPLHETVQVTSKTDPSVAATFEVVAEIR